MRKLRSVLAVCGLAAVSSLGVAACGSSSDDNGGGGGSSGAKPTSAKIGSVLPDNYDPVLFQTTQANEALQLVYTGLVTYKHAEGAAGNEIIPGLAEALPTVSADKKTYTFKLRSGLKYSDGSPVVASDFEHSIKRLNYLGGPFSSFTSSIEGVADYIKAKKPNADISGITSDDKTGEITVKLTEPDGKFLFAIALANCALTPAAKSPFKASTTIPGIGPYTIKILNPTREYILTKTPGFDVPGLAKGNIDKFDVVKQTVPQMTQNVIDNKLDFMTEDPTGDLLPQVKAKYSDRFRMDPNPPNTYWFFLNETTPSRSTTSRSARPSTTRSTAARCSASSAAGCSPAATSCRPATPATATRRSIRARTAIPPDRRTSRRPSRWSRTPASPARR